MPKKKTDEEFKNEIFQKVGNEYTVLGEYINNVTKILIKHNKCGHEYYVSPTNFIQGKRCPKCSGLMKKTTKEFKKEVYNLVKDEYMILGEYINTSTKILMKHNRCGHEYLVTPRNFIQGTRCPKCYGNIKKTTLQFKKEVFNLVGNEYIVLGEYINNSNNLKMKHNKCGHEYYVSPTNFIQGYRCPKCSGLMKKTTEQFKEEVFQKVGNEYTVLGEYVNNHTKILMKHNKCGHEYFVTFTEFKKGNRCPYCRESKGEKTIINYLSNNNIEYKQQVSFPDCKNIRNLKFDFQIFLKDNKNIILIEYDGIQHFEASFSKKHFKEQQIRDKIKDNYCKENKIHLYRINYKDFNNIENILNNIIEKESSTTIESID